MLKQNADDIDYENLDDLPLFDHIEWLSNLTVKARLYQQNFSIRKLFKSTKGKFQQEEKFR